MFPCPFNPLLSRIVSQLYCLSFSWYWYFFISMVLLNAAWYGFVWIVLMIGYGLNTYRKNSSIFLSTLHGGRRLRGSWYWSLVNVTLITWLKQYLPRIKVGVFFNIYLFLAPLRLRCYVQQTFSSCSKLEPLFIVWGLLIAVASLVAEDRL